MARAKTKICYSCQRAFRGRIDAKTCSETCRKRLQRAQASAEKDLLAIQRRIEDSLRELEDKMAPAADEGGFIGDAPAPAVPPAVQPGAVVTPVAEGGTEHNLFGDEQEIAAAQPEVLDNTTAATAPTGDSYYHFSFGRYRWAVAAFVLIIIGLASMTFLFKDLTHPAGKNNGTVSASLSAGGATSSAGTLELNNDTTVAGGKLFTATGNVVVKDANDSATAVVIQNSAGSNLFAADTVNNQIIVGGNLNSSGSLLASGGGSSLSNAGLVINGITVCTAAGCGNNNVSSLLANATLQGNSFNGPSQLVQLNGSGGLPTLNGSLLTNLNAGNISSGTISDARLSGNVALLNANQIFTGNNTFTAQLQAATVNAISGYSYNGTAGSSFNCSAGNLLSNPVVQGGIITGGICALGNGASIATLQDSYDASTPATIVLSSASGPLVLQDAATPLGTDLFAVTSNGGGTKYFEVKSTGVATNGRIDGNSIFQNGSQVCDLSGNCAGVTGIGGSGTAGTIAQFTGGGSNIGDSILTQSGSTVTATGNLNVTGQYQVSGSQIASTNLSDGSNLAKLNGTQTFSGANTFSNASNAFTGNGSGLSSLNASNISSGTLNNARLNSDVALTDRNSQTFTGNQQVFQNGINSTTAFAIQNTGGNAIFTADTTGNQIVLGKASALDGKLVFNSAGGSGSIAIVPASPGVSSFSITLPAENGIICTTAASAACTAVYSSATGGSGYVQLQGSTPGTQQTGNFNISGTGRAGTLLQNGNQVCDVSGNCVGVSGGSIGGSGTANTIAMFTGSGFTIGNSLLAQSGGTVTVTGNLNATGQIQVAGSQISSSNLSDGGNLAKLNGTQTFSGANTFSNVSNAFTGDGSGLTNLNASNISSGTLNNSRLNSDVALTDRSSQTFTGANSFNNTSTTAFQIQNSSGLGNLFVADTTNTRIGIGAAPANYLLTIGGNTTTNTGGIIFGTDTQADLFRLAAGTLKTDGNFFATGEINATSDVRTNTIVSQAGGTQALGITAQTTSIISQGTTIKTGAAGIANAFQVQDSSSFNVLNADTLNSRVTLGQATHNTGTLVFNNSTNSDTITITPAPSQTANYTLQLPALAAGTYDVCTNAGNCVGTGGSGALGGSGTANTIAMFTGSGFTVGNSNLAQSGSTVTATGNLNVTGQYQVGGSQISSSNLSNDSNLAKLNGTQTFTGVNSFNNTSTTAFQIQNSGGTSNLFVADTTNTRIGIGAAPANSLLTIGTNTSTPAGGITFGTDTGLYRSASARLQTNGDFYSVNTVASGLIQAGSNMQAATEICARYTDVTSGPSCIGNVGPAGQAGIKLGVSGDTSLYRGAANTLQTNSNFILRSGTNSTTAFQIQNTLGTSNLFVADTTNTRIAIGQATATYTLDVAGDINTTTGYRVGGNAGSSVTCSGGNVLQNTTVNGGIITGGSCVSTAQTFSTVYNNGSTNSDETATLTSGNGGLVIQDAATPIGANLFTVQSNGGATKYFSVTASGASVAGNFNITGQYQIGGVQISSANLSNDSNLAKLNAANIFTATNTFRQADNTAGIILQSTTASSSKSSDLVFKDNQASPQTLTLRKNGSALQFVDNSANVEASIGLDGAATYFAPTTGNVGVGITTAGAKLHVLGTTTSAITLLVQQKNSQTGDLFDISNSGATANAVKVDGANGTTALRNFNNSSFAFQVQNAAGATLLNVNTLPPAAANLTNVVSNGDFEGDSTAGWTAKGSTALAIISDAWQGQGSLYVNTTTAAGDGAKYAFTLSPTTTYTLSMYVDSGAGTLSDVNIGRQENGSDIDCLTGQTVTTGWKRYVCTFTTGATISGSNIYIKKTGVSAEQIHVDGVQLQVNGTATAFDAGGSLQLDGIINSPVDIQNKADSSAAFQVQNAAGTVLLGVDTASKLINIDSTAGLTFDGGAAKESIFNSSGELLVGNYNAGGNVQVQASQFEVQNTTDFKVNFNLNSTGQALFKNSTNSTTAFQIQPASSTTPVFDVDTASGLVGIGTSAPGNALDVRGSGNFQGTSTAELTIQSGSFTKSLVVDTQNNVTGIGAAPSGSGATLQVAGSALITANSSTAFKIQNTSNVSMFTVDTNSSMITLGSASATPVILVLGNKNTSGDPTCTSGAIYYNSSSSRLRACANGTWGSFGPYAPGYQLDYSTFTSPVNAGNGPTQIVSGNAVTYDGNTTVKIDFYVPSIIPSTSTGCGGAYLYEDGSSIDRYLSVCSDVTAAGGVYSVILTPTSGSHTFSVYGSGTNTGLTFTAGAGGSSNFAPGYIRITVTN